MSQSGRSQVRCLWKLFALPLTCSYSGHPHLTEDCFKSKSIWICGINIICFSVTTNCCSYTGMMLELKCNYFMFAGTEILNFLLGGRPFTGHLHVVIMTSTNEE